MSAQRGQQGAGGRVVLVGEVLVDVFPDGREVLGGAPFNVAWHLAGLGLEPLLVSRVGRDEAGRRVRAALEEWGMDGSGVQEDPRLPTGRVEVRLAGGDDSGRGEPRFEILPDLAWDHLDATAARRLLASLPSQPELVYRGTLAERSPASRRALAEVVAATGAAVFLDLNLRPPWARHERTEAALEQARWAKVNRDELEEVHGRPVGRCPEDVLGAGRAVRKRWGLDALIVTRGERGAVWITAEREVTVAPDAPVAGDGTRAVDTVGAGDALAAVVILGLLHGWPAEVILRQAVDFAAEVCRRRGATPREPELYRRWRERLGVGGTETAPG